MRYERWLEHGFVPARMVFQKAEEKKRKEKQLKPNEYYLLGADSIVQHYLLSFIIGLHSR